MGWTVEGGGKANDQNRELSEANEMVKGKD